MKKIAQECLKEPFNYILNSNSRETCSDPLTVFRLEHKGVRLESYPDF